MKLRTVLLTATLGMAGWLVVASSTPARADQYDRYYDSRYYRGRDSYEVRWRDLLRGRMLNLADRIRLAERERAISPGRARDMFEELDDVRDFLVHDHYLNEREFDRRMDDLDDVDRDLRDASGRRYGRYYRSYDRGSYSYR